MSGDPSDPGPVLGTSDPSWEGRFDAARTMLDVPRARDEPVRDHDAHEQLTKGLACAQEVSSSGTRG